MAMRRSRLQIKPNLGPRAGPVSRSQPSAETTASPKPKTATSSASQPSVTSQDQFTVLKATESKSDSSVSSLQSLGYSDGSRSTALKSPLATENVGSISQRGPVRAGIVSRSPSKSLGAELGAVQSSGKNDTDAPEHVSPRPRNPVTVNPPRARSVRTPSTPVINVTESLSAEKQAKSHPTVPVSSPMKSPLLGGDKGRLPRTRFSKVMPNLAVAGRHKSRTSNRGQSQGPESEAKGQGEGEGHAKSVAVDAGNEEHVATAEDVIQSGQSIGEQSQTETVSATPAGSVTPTQETESNQAKDVADLASETSAPPYSESDVQDESVSGDSELPAKPDDKKKSAAEKKARRPKGVLPSSDAAVDRSAMKMVDLIYWNPNRNRMNKNVDRKKESQQAKASANNTSQEMSSSLSVDDEASNNSDSLPVPQVKIGPDGNIILNIESLVVENKTLDSAEQNNDFVEEDDDRFVNCNSFRDYKKGKFWTKNETNRFFRALQQVGTDFSLMCSLFPSRSRRELKNKFRKEEKNNRTLVDKALREREQFDRRTFEIAKEEDEAENARRLKIKVERVRKRKKREAGDNWGEDGEEDEEDMDEDDLAALEAMEEEERKENSIQRKRGPTVIPDDDDDEDAKFPSYERKQRRREPSSKHTKEVVDILINMSCGKVPAKDEDEISETSSFISEGSSIVDGSEDQPFVPKVARKRARPDRNRQRRSGSNVVIDPLSSLPIDSTETYLETLPGSSTVVHAATGTSGYMYTGVSVDRPQGSENKQGVCGGTPHNLSGFSPYQMTGASPGKAVGMGRTFQQNCPVIQICNPNSATAMTSGSVLTNQTVTTSFTQNLSVPQHGLVTSIPAQNFSVFQGHAQENVPTIIGGSQSLLHSQSVAQIQGGGLTIPPSVLSAIEQLQADSSNVDVVLVEEHNGGQGVVHVYVVPKAATEIVTESDQNQGQS